MERQIFPGTHHVSTARAELHRREMGEWLAARRLDADSGRTRGWLVRAMSRGIAAIGQLMVRAGEWLLESSQPMTYTAEDRGSC